MSPKNDNKLKEKSSQMGIFVPYKWMSFSSVTPPIWVSSKQIESINIEYRTENQDSVSGDTGPADRQEQEVWRLGFESYEDFFEG